MPNGNGQPLNLYLILESIICLVEIQLPEVEAFIGAPILGFILTHLEIAHVVNTSKYTLVIPTPYTQKMSVKKHMKEFMAVDRHF